MSCKNTLILKEIVFPYFAQFKTIKAQKEAFLMPKAYNVEHLVERAIEIAGGIKFVDGDGLDHEDGSETKTASIRPSFFSSISAKLEISNVGRFGVEGHGEKFGDLRLIIYNPWMQELAYFFLPKSFWSNCSMNIHPTTRVGRLFGRWNCDNGMYYLQPGKGLNTFRLDTFDDLAKMPANTTEDYFTKNYSVKTYFEKYPKPKKTCYDFY